MYRFILALAVLISGSTAAQAAPLFAVTNPTGFGLGNPPFTLGFQFTVGAGENRVITALGVFDDSSNGLVDSHAVGLWDSVGTLLASTTVPAGTAGTLVDQFRYAAIGPLTLAPGTYTIGALYLTGNDPLIFPGSATGFATAPNITFLADRFAGAGVLTFPTASTGTQPAYFGPNAIVITPEPATIFLFAGLGLAGAMGFRRRKLTPA